MKKSGIYTVIVAVLLTTLACTLSFNVPASQPGETKTINVNESAPGSTPARVEINMLGGELDLSGGGSNLVSGTIDYNLAEWEPKISQDGDTLIITQDAKTLPVLTDNRMVNRWALKFGDTPMFLSVNAGAYDGEFDLSGVPLTGLEIQGGASNSEVHFDTPNPQEMQSFDYQTGASNVKIYGLGNAGPANFTFKCGAGDYTIDFSGTPQRAIQADLTGALGSMTVIVPSGVAAQVNLTGGLSNVNLEGSWTVHNDQYSTSGSGPGLTINITMSVGQLNLQIK